MYFAILFVKPLNVFSMFSTPRAAIIFGLVGVTLALVLVAIRLNNAVSFSVPLQLDTSGAEWESLYAVWRILNGEALYTDRREIPFNAVVYNWLFYNSFAAFTGIGLKLAGLSDMWLPTVARVFSLLGAMVGTVISYLSFRRAFDVTHVNEKAVRVIIGCFAIYLFFGPLMGWWVFTVRSDLWGMVLEIAGVMIFLRYYRSNWVAAVLALALFAYLAWSFKQINVFAVGAGGLFLLLRGDWRSILLLSIGFVALVGATFLIGGEDYVENILFSITAQFTWTTYFRNLTNFLVKSGPTLFPLAVLIAAVFHDQEFRRRIWANDHSLLAISGIAVTAPIISLASSKYGASEVYYLTLSYFLVLAGLSCTSDIIAARGRSPKPLTVALSLGWLSFIAAILLVLAGVQGTIDLRPHHELMMAMKRCIDPLPRPVFISHGRLALPWMAPGQSPNFVTSFSYNKERKAGVEFEAGGIAGLIESGYFKSLAIYGTKRPQMFDGLPLDGFKYLGGCEKLQLFVR